jgi:hypothetical protein
MKLEYEVGFLLSRATWAMNNSVNRMLRENGLWKFVAYLRPQALWENDGMSITDLGKKPNWKSTTTSQSGRMGGRAW